MSGSTMTAGALAMLRDHHRFAVICHAAPDSDCVGGLMAMTHALRSIGKVAFPLSPDRIPDYLEHVPGADAVPFAVERLPAVDAVVTIEAASLQRIDPIYTSDRLRLERLPLLNIDHHVTNTGYGTERVFDPAAGAVCEVLYRLFGELPLPINETIAYCLLTGIIGDTRSFRTSSTTPDTLKVAGELIAAGAPLSTVSDAVNKYRRAAEIPLWADMLARTKCEDGVLWTTVCTADAERFGLALEQIDGIVEFLSDTRDIAVSAVFKALAPDRIRISMRSDGRVDLTSIAAIYGGGGHPRASGCTAVGVGMEEAATTIVGALKQALHG